ncbi:hypothetical protein KUL113_56280 [Tenacibaculum sp. KUL113]|nr:hypothetical protein KUL113_56280 [Tenacibaculum sp. KUL113]
MSNRMFIKLFLIVFTIVISCKKRDSNSETKVLTKEKKTIKKICNVSGSNVEISLLEDDNDKIYLSVKTDNSSLEKKIDLDEYGELNTIDVECGKESFKLIFIEEIGNSFQKIIHLFEKDSLSKFSIDKVYIQTSSRNELGLFYYSFPHLNLSNYNGILPQKDEYNEIYKFSGFQEYKTPNIEEYYEKIKKARNEKNTLSSISNEIVLAFIINNIDVSEGNLSKYNDIGYFLEQSGLYEEAVYILEVIIKEFPNRTVAYINLGDAYWGLGKKEEAKQAYKIYIEQMKAKNKESKIPSQVLERIS